MKKIFYALLAVIICVSCEKKADYETLFLDKSELNFPAEGGTLSFHVECPMNWTILKEGSLAEIQPMSGNGSQDVFVTLPPNYMDAPNRIFISVRAENGVTKPINAYQLSNNNTDSYIDVPSSIILGGKSHIEGEYISVSLTYELPWEMSSGPEWLEMSYDGKTWFPSSGGLSGSQSSTLYVRAASDNNDESDRSYTLTFIENGFNTTVSCNVIQVGRIRSRLGASYTCANSNASELVLGCNVEKVYLKVTETEYDPILLYEGKVPTKEEFMQWDCYEVKDTKEKLITKFSDLKENTFYYAYRVSVNGDDYHVAYSTFRTKTKENQPSVGIGPAQFSNGQWTWNTIMSSNTSYYWLWVTDNQELFNECDALLSMYAVKEGKAFVTNSSHSKKGSGPYMIVTYALDSDLRRSGIVNRLIVGK